MSKLRYVGLSEIDLDDLKALLNKKERREHLIEHSLFDSNTIKSWVKEKIQVDSKNGCRIRGIISNNSIAGWCGIQFEDEKYEVAIVLGNEYWGIGTRVFRDIMSWAHELGHDEIFIRLLHTRSEYKFLRKRSKNVFVSEHLGNRFTTYQLSVN